MMKYSFIGDTTYSLLLYMLYASEEMLSHTKYYVGRNLASLTLSDKVVMPPMLSFDDKTRFLYRLKCLKYRWALSHSEIYAQDHLFFSSPLIDNLGYTLLEDCPNFFTNFDYHQHLYNERKWRERIQNICLGRIGTHYRGYNPWCKNRILTTDRDIKFFGGLKTYAYEQVNLQQLWNGSSIQKRESIIAAYNLDEINHDGGMKHGVRSGFNDKWRFFLNRCATMLISLSTNSVLFFCRMWRNLVLRTYW